MSIGYSVEGSTDRAFVEGLRQRWCPGVILIEGAFRGKSIRRAIPNICRELSHKGASVIVFLTDANDQNWREVRRRESNLVPDEFRHVTLYGVADRNIECWLNSDRDYLAKRLGISPNELDVPDPQGVFEAALRITDIEEREKEIASIVCDAPLHHWLARSPSFEAFYEDARRLSQQLQHPIRNELG
jgi:hypothetical protein